MLYICIKILKWNIIRSSNSSIENQEISNSMDVELQCYEHITMCEHTSNSNETSWSSCLGQMLSNKNKVPDKNNSLEKKQYEQSPVNFQDISQADSIELFNDEDLNDIGYFTPDDKYVYVKDQELNHENSSFIEIFSHDCPIFKNLQDLFIGNKYTNLKYVDFINQCVNCNENFKCKTILHETCKNDIIVKYQDLLYDLNSMYNFVTISQAIINPRKAVLIMDNVFKKHPKLSPHYLMDSQTEKEEHYLKLIHNFLLAKAHLLEIFLINGDCEQNQSIKIGITYSVEPIKKIIDHILPIVYYLLQYKWDKHNDWYKEIPNICADKKDELSKQFLFVIDILYQTLKRLQKTVTLLESIEKYSILKEEMNMECEEIGQQINEYIYEMYNLQYSIDVQFKEIEIVIKNDHEMLKKNFYDKNNIDINANTNLLNTQIYNLLKEIHYKETNRTTFVDNLKELIFKDIKSYKLSYVRSLLSQMVSMDKNDVNNILLKSMYMIRLEKLGLYLLKSLHNNDFLENKCLTVFAIIPIDEQDYIDNQNNSLDDNIYACIHT